MGYINKIKLIVLPFAVFTSSCESFLEIDDPSSQLISVTVFEDELTANAAMAGLYGRMCSIGGFSGGSTKGVSLLSSLSADDMNVNNTDASSIQFFENNITSTNPYLISLWNESYAYIYMANSVLEGLSKSVNLKEGFKKSMQGEAYFIRAFTHFYLVNLFGEIPYITTTDYRHNASVSRSPISEVYQMITIDLIQSARLLPMDYSLSTGERIRINKYVANAFQARVHLYLKDWYLSEKFADSVISYTTLYNLNSDVNEVFKMNNTEAIWQLKPGKGENYTNDGDLFLGTPDYYSLTNDLVDNIDDDDLRKENWIKEININSETRYIPDKYKDKNGSETLTEYSTVFRLSEQFLIRAEARANLNKLIGDNSAESDLNIIRTRAGLDPTAAATREDLLDAILAERRIEFFSEWGHRWLDLKRTGQIEGILNPKKPGWEPTDSLYAIPRSEVLANPNLARIEAIKN